MNPIVKQRLFLGIAYEPPATVVNLLDELQGLACQSAAKLSVVATANLHITLKFLGMVPEPDNALIEQVMEQLITSHQGFLINLRGIGFFRNSIWLGVEESEPLQSLTTQLNQAFSLVGFPAETKRYVAHLTVARIGRDAKFKLWELQKQYRQTRWGSLSVERVHLYKSTTLATGAEYSVLHTTELAGKPTLRQ